MRCGLVHNGPRARSRLGKCLLRFRPPGLFFSRRRGQPMTDRPTGAVTFLFTDVEGSTRLWDAHPEAMRGALAGHDALLRKTIESADGYVFSTAGDAFSAAFNDPAAAVRAAVDAQRRLSGETWGEVGTLNVRMAIHSGVAHERDGDYFGPALNRTARILSAAHGGQALVSLGTEELLGRSGLPEGVGLHDLGEHQLKDLARAERLFQLTHLDLRDAFPPILSLDAHPNNLPVQLTSFVGRQHDLLDVVKRLADNRLLTLTGVGGSGKTRLALQAAAESIADYRHGVWLVELASIGDRDLVAQGIADTLGLTRNQTTPGSAGGEVTGALDQVVEFLESRQVLLVLDNCEHLIGEAARVSEDLLLRCPEVSILTTSREGLGVPGEVLWQVPSLGVEDGGEASIGDAVLLFAQRASAVDSAFKLDAETLPHVTAVCRRLDGMPLAIELAAARARVLSAAQIAERLDDRFRLLTGGSRTALPRQQTLEATVDWSHDLLEDRERVLFRRLAAFRGGFTLEAAERVASGGEVDEFDVLDLVGQLVDKSMVVRDEGRDRFHMLETLRQYALGKLAESAEVNDVRTRHAEVFLDLATEADQHVRGPDQVLWLDRLGDDHDNFRAALTYCFEHDKEVVAVRTTRALSWFWRVRGHLTEAVEWQERCLPFLDEIGAAASLELRSLMAANFAWLGHGDYPKRAVELSEELVAEAEAMGDPALLGHALAARTIAANVSWDLDTAIGMARRAQEAYAAAGDDWGRGWAGFGEAWCYRLQAKVDEAVATLDEATPYIRKAGDLTTLTWMLSARAIMARYRFQFEDEVSLMDEVIDLSRQQGNRGGVEFGKVCSGISLAHLGRLDEAIERMEEGLRLNREQGVPGSDAETVGLLAWVSYLAGDRQRLDRYLPESFESCRRLEDAVTLAQNLEFLAAPLLDAGHREAVTRIFGYSDHHRAESGRPTPPPNVAAWEALRARVEKALRDDYAVQRDLGAAMSFDEALELGFEGSGLVAG